MERELVANKAAAARAEAPYEVKDPAARVQGLLKGVEGAVSKAMHNDNQRTDPVDQIRKLAELREAGAIIDEEFEGKKKDLLDRM